VFGGYHKDPAATAEAFTDDGWFKTGDVGRFTDDGFLQIVDRKKDILVTAGGKNVPPANIEQRFADDPLFSRTWSSTATARSTSSRACGRTSRRRRAPRRAPARRRSGRRGRARPRAGAHRSQGQRELASYETIKKFAIIDPPLTVEAGCSPPR
jgi:long-chain acyl-CoA synthetase